MDALELYPSWKQAAVEVAAGGLEPGRLLTKAELMTALRIGAPKTIDEYKTAQIQFVDGFVRLKQHLLTEHRVDLETVIGVGYQIIPPGQQTKLAMRDGAKSIAKAMRDTGRRLGFVDIKALSMGEQKEHDDACAKFSRLRGMVGRPSRFLSLTAT